MAVKYEVVGFLRLKSPGSEYVSRRIRAHSAVNSFCRISITLMEDFMKEQTVNSRKQGEAEVRNIALNLYGYSLRAVIYD